MAELREFATDSSGQMWSRSPDPKAYKHFSKFKEPLGVGIKKEKSTWSDHITETPYSNSIIEDTPENRAMIAQFVTKFEQLKDQFRKAMSQEFVTRFLASNSRLMLAAQPEE